VTPWIKGFEGVGIIVGATPPGDYENALVTCHGAVDSASGFVEAHEDRRDHLWEQHEIPHRKMGMPVPA
jgi:hypothetical protein